MGLVCVHPHGPLSQGVDVIAGWKMNPLEIIVAVLESGAYFLEKGPKCRQHEGMSGDVARCGSALQFTRTLFCDPGVN